MTRNRQPLRTVHLARTSKKDTAQADSPQPRRRRFRRIALAAAVAASGLIAAQIVFAAPPGANFTISDSVPEVGQSVNFTSSLTDTDTGQTYTYQWNFGDGGTSSAANPSHSYNSPGQKSVTLTVSDSGGETDPPVTHTLRVNAPPSPSFGFTPADPNPNQQIMFTSTSTDAEGPVTLAWDLDNDGAFDDGSDTSEAWSFPTGGTKTVRLRVTDNDGAVRETSRQVSVFLNSPPSASFNFSGTNPVTPNVPDVGEAVNFTSTSTDPDGNQTLVDWDWDLDGDGQFNNGSGPTIQHAFSTSRNKTVGLRVTDSSGAMHSTTRTVRVNALPVARANSLNPQAQTEPGQKYNVPLVNQPILFKGTSVPALPGTSPAQGCPASGGSPASPGSTDAEGAIAKYEWDLDNDGLFGTDDNPDDPTVADPPFIGFPTAGPKTVGLRVTDSDGATATTSLQLRVNTAPTAGFNFNPFSPIIGDQVTFDEAADDVDAVDAGLTYSWDLDNDGIFCETGEVGASVKRTFTTANTYPVKLRVTDTGGITREATRNVVVENTRPNGDFSFSPDAPLPGQPVTFTGSASSPTGKAIPPQNIQWDFDFPVATFNAAVDTFDINASGGSVTHAFSTPGPKTVALKIQEVGGGSRIVPRTVNVNAPPRAGFTVSPQEAFVGDGVTLSSTSADPDGPLTRQDWDLDGDGQFDDANAAVVSANFVNPGLHRLALRVTDSRGATSTATGQVMIRTRPIPPPPPTPLLSGVLVELRAAVYANYTKVRGLLVTAPKGSKIAVRCKGKGCPKLVTKVSKGSKKLRFKKLQRNFKPGRKLIVTVTKRGFIGKQTSWTIRRRKAPLRKDLCMNPGVKKASACPGG
jgi:PKD repeat protein